LALLARDEGSPIERLVDEVVTAPSLSMTIDRLAAGYFDALLVFMICGLARDREQSRAIVDIVGSRGIDLVGEIDICTFAALIADARIVLTNHTANRAPRGCAARAAGGASTSRRAKSRMPACTCSRRAMTGARGDDCGRATHTCPWRRNRARRSIVARSYW
jgi:hypothetical protein